MLFLFLAGAVAGAASPATPTPGGTGAPRRRLLNPVQWGTSYAPPPLAPEPEAPRKALPVVAAAAPARGILRLGAVTAKGGARVRGLARSARMREGPAGARGGWQFEPHELDALLIAAAES